MRTVLALLAVLGAVPHANAQATSVRCDSSSPYDACSLSVDGLSIRRGRDLALLAKDGWFTPLQLAPLVAGSDSALALAALHDRRATMAYRGKLASVVTIVAGLALYSARSRMPGGYRRDATLLEGGLTVVGSTALVVSAVSANRAFRLRQRAVWWYNRDLATR
jgi:hypothetical protein